MADVVVVPETVYKTPKGNFTTNYRDGYRYVVGAGATITKADAIRYGVEFPDDEDDD